MMTIRMTSFVAAVLVTAAFGCERDDKPSRTQTTSADDNFIERTRVIDDMFVNPSDNPASWGADASAARPPERARAAQGERAADSADAGAHPAAPSTAPTATVPPARDLRATPAGPRDPWDPPPIAPR